MESAGGIANTYRKLDHRAHVLLRPGMYVGSVEPDLCSTWVYDSAADKMVFRQVQYIPALYKIFDEILMNAVDHSVRLKRGAAAAPSHPVNPVRNIKVDIDQESGTIKVWNDGDGIDVEMHPEHNCYVPELIFGHLLTSANYDDDDTERIIGGQNGIGAKACNIFSSSFVVETVDAVRKKIYTQRFCNNMQTAEKPVVKACAKKPYTCITFTPDYARFGCGDLKSLGDDMYALMTKRVYDATAVTDADVAVHLNSKKLECKTFERYVDMYVGGRTQTTRVYEKLNDAWEIVVACAPTDSSAATSFQHVSFVNGVWTMRGGKHIDYVVGMITRKLGELIQDRKKDVVIKPQYLRDNLFVFLKSTIPNPSFDSQSKETLTTPANKFGCRVEVNDKFIEKLYKLDLVERALALSQATSQKALKKTDGKKQSTITGIPKLDDANWAGTSKSQQCTLILTEGDSAKTMAISGLDQVGRDKYGVYPLRGKVMNVCDASAQKIADNKEISDIKKILGLETGKVYTSTAELRYGRVMALTDADSVTGDTPLLLRDPSNGMLDVRTIDDVAASEWTCFVGSDKEYSTTPYEVWTDKGWTRIRRVMRHMTQKKMFRVLTHTGCVDVTEDHSLLDKHGNEVPPSACSVGQELMHSFPQFGEHMPIVPSNLESLNYMDVRKVASSLGIRYYQQKRKTELINMIKEIMSRPTIELAAADTVSVDEAWVMGLFWADGTCGVYKWEATQQRPDRPRPYTFNRTSYSWSIANTNMDYLDKAKTVMQSLYDDLEFKIIIDRSCEAKGNQRTYKLIINGGVKTADIVHRYRELFYDTLKKKRVPPLVLNASEAVRRAFYDGYYAGDGAKSEAHSGITFDVDGKVGAMGIFFLCRSLGFLVSVNIRLDKPKIYCICLTPPGGHQQRSPDIIKKIVDMGATEQYVYDLETENHHFHAGVGQMIVHNTDGSHIKGLVMYLFQRMWPSLLKIEGFMTSMLTPIVKTRKRTARGEQVLEFFNVPEFDAWLSNNDAGRGWDVKYYKGLGTSTSKEAKEYFRKMRMVVYRHSGPQSDDMLDLAFNKKRADDRKNWLMQYDKSLILDYGNSDVSLENFVNKDLSHFSNYDLVRSIPNLMDGLKVSQRKVLYAMFKKNIVKQEIRVASLSGIVQTESAYHHGDAALNGTIASMAQDFVGSNNVNLLLPNGQFGSRVQGGADCASARYIHTMLNPVALKIFIKDDENVLVYNEDDGQRIEPEFYLPIIPMILVNGTIGIGTGFSTNVPCYNPTEVIDALLEGIDAYESLSPTLQASNDFFGVDKVSLTSRLRPWYRGFKGVIEDAAQKGKYISRGVYERIAPMKVRITELPIGTWTETFKELLDELLQSSPDVKKVDCNYGDETVDFTVHFASAEVLDEWLREHDGPSAENRLVKELKLSSNKYLNTSNMYLFDAAGRIKKYNTPEDMIVDFIPVRLEGYKKRKSIMLDAMQDSIALLGAKSRFLQEVIDGDIVVSSVSKAALETVLEERGYARISDSFDHLTRMPIYSLTMDKKREIDDELDKTRSSHAAYEKRAVFDLWRADLDALRQALAV